MSSLAATDTSPEGHLTKKGGRNLPARALSDKQQRRSNAYCSEPPRRASKTPFVMAAKYGRPRIRFARISKSAGEY
jgi:hypothetical protein